MTEESLNRNWGGFFSPTTPFDYYKAFIDRLIELNLVTKYIDTISTSLTNEINSSIKANLQNTADQVRYSKKRIFDDTQYSTILNTLITKAMSLKVYDLNTAPL